MRQLATLAERRLAARGLAPLTREALELMRQRDTQNCLHKEHVELRSARVLQLTVRGLEGCCEWSLSQAWSCLDPSDEHDEEAA
jgi:hypothetical protein